MKAGPGSWIQTLKNLFNLAICEKKFSFEQAKELDRHNERRPHTTSDYNNSTSSKQADSLPAQTPASDPAQTSVIPANPVHNNKSTTTGFTAKPSIQIIDSISEASSGTSDESNTTGAVSSDEVQLDILPKTDINEDLNKLVINTKGPDAEILN